MNKIKVITISLWHYDADELIKLLPQFNQLELLIIPSFGQMSDIPIKKHIKRIMRKTCAVIDLRSCYQIRSLKNLDAIKNFYLNNPCRLLLNYCDRCVQNYYSDNPLLCPHCESYLCPVCGIMCVNLENA